jgi:putative endonuclease
MDVEVEQMADYYAYIMTNHTRMLYVGMIDDIRRRTFEYKTGFFVDSFTDRYRMGMLVNFEEVPDAIAAAQRERQLKGWTRKKKIALIEKSNANWIDLGDRWFTEKELESGIMLPRNDRSSALTHLQSGASRSSS